MKIKILNRLLEIKMKKYFVRIKKRRIFASAFDKKEIVDKNNAKTKARVL